MKFENYSSSYLIVFISRNIEAFKVNSIKLRIGQKKNSLRKNQP